MTTPQESWEKGFDIEFEHMKPPSRYTYGQIDSKDWKELKAFISQAIEAARREEREKVKNGLLKLGYTQFVYNNDPLILHPKSLEIYRIKDYFLSLTEPRDELPL